MEVETLRAFVAVARAGGFSAAARQENVTQPSLSRRVQALEKEVAARLVVRTPRGVQLTRAGERFLEHAERALRALQAGITEVGELHERPQGTVTVGAIATVAAYVLPRVIAAFLAEHPEVDVRIREGFPTELEELLARGELDLAIFTLPVRRGDLSARRLWSEDYVLAVPPGHALVGARKVDLSDVVREKFVVIPGAAATLAYENACAARGVVAQVVVSAESVESLRRLVAHGIGLGLVPRIAVDDPSHVVEVGKGRVVRQVALVHRGEETLTAAGRALRTAIHARTRPG
ncbi:MAG: LysR family transcriptional regulator [Sandaracinaceae bacterium]|nr:LysR family transcriptional regulator [Sandaracinaceae bacterium]